MKPSNAEHPATFPGQFDATCSSAIPLRQRRNIQSFMRCAHSQLTRACGGVQMEVDVEGRYVCAAHWTVNKPTPHRALMTSKPSHAGEVVAVITQLSACTCIRIGSKMIAYDVVHTAARTRKFEERRGCAVLCCSKEKVLTERWQESCAMSSADSARSFAMTACPACRFMYLRYAPKSAAQNRLLTASRVTQNLQSSWPLTSRIRLHS